MVPAMPEDRTLRSAYGKRVGVGRFDGGESDDLSRAP